MDGVSDVLAEHKMPMLLSVVGVLLVFVLLIVYISFKMKSSNLRGKTLVATPLNLGKLSSVTEVTSDVIPKGYVGLEYSYAWWVYLTDNEQLTTNNKMLFYRGAVGDITSANPVVYMDGITNKMTIAVKTKTSSLTSTSGYNYNVDLRCISQRNYFEQSPTLSLVDANVNTHILLNIDYVPLQRWVHIAYSVDNKLLTVFMDSEVYSVRSTDEIMASRMPAEIEPTSGLPMKYSLIVDKTDGNIEIGSGTVGANNTIDGYLSRMDFFNYGLSYKDVKDVYRKGPFNSNIMTKLGITSYGMRSPLYKIPHTTS